MGNARPRVLRATGGVAARVILHKERTRASLSCAHRAEMTMCGVTRSRWVSYEPWQRKRLLLVKACSSSSLVEMLIDRESACLAVAGRPSFLCNCAQHPVCVLLILIVRYKEK